MLNDPNAITIDITAYGDTFKCRLETDRYTNDRLCLMLTYWDSEMQGWFPHAKLTVNLPDQHLNTGEVFVKDWSENEPIIPVLLEAGWFTPAGREVVTGGVIAPVMKLAGPLEGIV